MFKWFQGWSSLSRELKWFVFSLGSLGLITVAAVIYAYIRLAWL